MHFSDQHMGPHKKILVFKFALPGANHMAQMTRLVALVPYYIDLIGRYKLSSQVGWVIIRFLDTSKQLPIFPDILNCDLYNIQARSKTEAARQKVAQGVYKELQNARQEALHRKKAQQKKLLEEAQAKLSAEARTKKEAKERARQMKKAMPKVKMTRAH